MMLFDVTKKLALVMLCFTCSVIYILLQPRPCFTFREFELCFISRLRLKNGPVVLAFPMYHLTTAFVVLNCSLCDPESFKWVGY